MVGSARDCSRVRGDLGGGVPSGPDVARIRRLVSDLLHWLEKEYDKMHPLPPLPRGQPDEENWKRWIGKESGLGALTKLTQLLTKIVELEQSARSTAPPPDSSQQQDLPPLTEEEWRIIQRFVQMKEGDAAPLFDGD